jgi:hypothetical protein
LPAFASSLDSFSEQAFRERNNNSVCVITSARLVADAQLGPFLKPAQ